jgi:hypothetical protein
MNRGAVQCDLEVQPVIIIVFEPLPVVARHQPQRVQVANHGGHLLHTHTRRAGRNIIDALCMLIG